MKGKTSELRAMLARLEVGVTTLVHGANGGTVRTLMHKLHGPGSYVVRTAPDGVHRVTLIRGADNATRASVGLPPETVRAMSAAQRLAMGKLGDVGVDGEM